MTLATRFYTPSNVKKTVAQNVSRQNLYSCAGERARFPGRPKTGSISFQRRRELLLHKKECMNSYIGGARTSHENAFMLFIGILAPQKKSPLRPQPPAPKLTSSKGVLEDLDEPWDVDREGLVDVLHVLLLDLVELGEVEAREDALVPRRIGKIAGRQVLLSLKL